MRLLKREQNGGLTNTDTFSLVRFDPQNIPLYAILSHRWGSEEVTFKDLENGTARTKAGYKKLEFLGEQAARDGLLFFWIDTCCIDKTSSAELSEAINSMFKWYKNATKCYAYLSDVSVHDSVHDISIGGKWEAAFEKSEWFTRGWTLQELIAPMVVEFFSVEGRKLGDKRSLERQTHQITGISIEALQGKPLSNIDEKERLSWTVRRRTTVEEDAAYCLLGIFDIHMSLIYGEGQQKALARLQRKIQQSSHPKLFAVTDAPWIVPFERNPLFTGRESQLAELEAKLFAKDHTSKIAITGLGGVGKTQLVLELLYRTKEKHKDYSVIWIPATTIESLQQGYLVVAQQLKIPGCEDEKADMKKLVQDHLSREDADQWLLVYDNADDIDMWTATPTLERKDTGGMFKGSLSGSRRLIDYVPKSKRGCIIFTTRDRKAAVKLAQRNIIAVSELSEEAATQLLKSSLADPDLTNNPQDVTALLASLTYLPLAITQATAYINANGITLADYISFLEDKEEQTIEILSEDFEDYGRYQNVKNPVALTWLISFDQIQRSDPLAAEYLSFMACVSPKDIPQSLLPPGPSRKKEIEAIGTLTAYSFVSRRSANTALDLHRLVHLTTRNWLRNEELLSQWMEKTIIRLEEVFPDDDHEKRTAWRAYLPHVCQVLASDLVNKDGEQRMDLMRKCGRCLFSDGRWDEAEAIFTEILAMNRKTFGEESSFTLNSMAWLASTYRDQGRWEQAEQLQVEVMKTRKAKLGADHPYTLTSINNLASIYWNQGRWELAEQLQVEVIKTGKAKLGADHPYTLTSMNDLALTYLDQGRWEQAEQLQVEVMETRKARQGADHPDTLTSMNNLALTYSDLGRWEQAEQLHIEVLETCKTKLGANHPHTLSSMAGLAATYWNQGRWEQAEQLHIEVLETRKTKLGANHPHTLTSMNDLAATYWNQGQWEQAEQLQVEVLEIYKTKLGADHPHTLTSMNNLTWTWKKLGRDADAIQLMRDCVQRQDRILSATHPDSLSSRKTLSKWEAERSDTSTELGTREDVT